MPTVIVDQISKRFGDTLAVNNVSFNVQPGEIFGLLGPNGAGKTTSIRIMLDIFKADSGSVSIFNGPMTPDKLNKIGYLPEERGLYQDIPLDRCLNFLALLKGMDKSTADKLIVDMMEKFDLISSRKKKVKELSKGMQQKAQLIATLVHNPDLLIIDEPFSSLDPINTQMVKDLLQQEREKGKAIVMCTHQMAQVEQLCDRLVLIDRGSVILSGSLADIRKKFASHDVLILTESPIPTDIEGVESVVPHNSRTKIKLLQDYTPQSILTQLVQKGVILEDFEIAVPSLDEIFIKVVSGKEQEDA